MPLLLPRPHLPSLRLKRSAQGRVTDASPDRPRRTYASKSLPFSFKSKPRTYRPKRFSLSPSPNVKTTSPSHAPSRTPSSNAENLNDAASLPEPGTFERLHTGSSKSSSRSSIRRASTIVIEPSHGLRAMQSVGYDTNPTSDNAAWRSSDRYLSRSQISIPTAEVYKPTGSPEWLLEELNHRANRALPRRIPSSPLQVTNWNQASDWEEPTYGPSAEDLADLIERQNKFDEEQVQLQLQRPKSWRPLHRLSSLKKELAGGIKRTMSLRKKKSFEPRTGPVRSKSEKEASQNGERAGAPKRHNTIGAAYARRWSVMGQKTDPERKKDEV